MLAHRLRRRPNNKPTLAERLVFAGKFIRQPLEHTSGSYSHMYDQVLELNKRLPICGTDVRCDLILQIQVIHNQLKLCRPTAVAKHNFK